MLIVLFEKKYYNMNKYKIYARACAPLFSHFPFKIELKKYYKENKKRFFCSFFVCCFGQTFSLPRKKHIKKNSKLEKVLKNKSLPKICVDFEFPYKSFKYNFNLFLKIKKT